MSDTNGSGDRVVWSLPVHRSLIKPIYWMGVPRGLLVLEFFLAVMGGIIFKTFMILPIVALVHFVFQYLGEKDPVFYKVIIRSLRHNGFYGG